MKGGCKTSLKGLVAGNGSKMIDFVWGASLKCIPHHVSFSFHVAIMDYLMINHTKYQQSTLKVHRGSKIT